MDNPAIIVEGEIYEFSFRNRSKEDLKGRIGAVTKIKLSAGCKCLFTDENGKLLELDPIKNNQLMLITDQYRVIDFGSAYPIIWDKSYYILTDTNDLIVINVSDDGTLEAPVTINNTKFLKIFSYYGYIRLIDISGNLWCTPTYDNYKMFPALPIEGQIVYQVTDGFDFVDCGASFSHICALDSAGVLYIGGDGDFLPFEPNDDRNDTYLSKTNCPIKFRAVATSDLQTAYIDFDNNLWMSGYAKICGVNADTRENIPITKVLENVDSVSCYGEMTCALLIDGTLLCTGESNKLNNPWSSLVFEKVFDRRVDKLLDDKENIARYKKTKSARKAISKQTDTSTPIVE